MRKAYRKEPQQDIACCPIIKCKLNDLAGLEREAQERIARTNQNIDKSRTKFNLYIKGIDDNGEVISSSNKYETTLEQRVMNRIQQVGAYIRHDKTNKKAKKSFVEKGKNTKESVVAVAIELQFSHPLSVKIMAEDGLLDANGKICRQLQCTDKMYQILIKSYKFICDHYGRENVVGTYIHLDEYTPHLHVFVVPIAFKQRKYRSKKVVDANGQPKFRGVLDAKHIFDNQALRKQWADYGKAMSEFGAKCAQGLAPKGSYDDVASIEGMLRSSKATLANLEDEILSAENEKENLENENKKLIATNKTLNDSQELLREKISDTNDEIEAQKEKYDDVCQLIKQKQNELLSLSSKATKEMISDMPNSIRMDVQQMISKYFKGNIVEIEETKCEFELDGNTYMDDVIQITMNFNGKEYLLEICESDGRVWKNDKLVTYDDGKEMIMKEIADYYKAQITEETKEFIKSLYHRKKENVIWEWHDGIKASRIIQCADNIYAIQKLSIVKKNGQVCHEWELQDRFTSFKIMSESQKDVVILIQSGDITRIVNQYGVEIDVPRTKNQLSPANKGVGVHM